MKTMDITTKVLISLSFIAMIVVLIYFPIVFALAVLVTIIILPLMVIYGMKKNANKKIT